MADWVHCNKCSIIYKPHVKFFLTECSHIFCQSCIAGIKETKCIVCQKSNCCIEICKDMDPNIQSFFTPYEHHLKKLMEYWQFQMSHRMRQFQTVTKKYAFAKRECIKLHNKVKELTHEKKMQQNWIEQVKTAIMNGVVPQSLFRSDQLISSTPALMTPAMTSDRTGIDNISQISSIPPCTPTSNYGRSNPTPPGWKRPAIHGGSQIHPQYQQQHQQQRSYPPNFAPGGSGGQYPQRGPYRRSPAQMVPGSGGRTPMRGNLPPPMGGAAVSMHHLQQQGSGANRT